MAVAEPAAAAQARRLAAAGIEMRSEPPGDRSMPVNGVQRPPIDLCGARCQLSLDPPPIHLELA
ncbi:MAG: hypothetical protein HRT86_12390 [Ilumatobacteraceae bacterium]|nr:hypothetical protein [Ilumatobacteraceae bacterium]